jgi:tetratricopeptide (TPR) repeat protein
MASNNRISYPLALGIVVALVVTLGLGWAVAVRQREAATPHTPQELAVTSWQKAARENGNDAGTQTRYAFALYNYAMTKPAGKERTSLLTRSVQAYDAALRLSTNSQAAKYNRAVTLEALGKTDEALAAYEVLIKENNGQTDAARLAGLIYLKRNDVKNALSRLKLAVSAFPDAADVRVSMAQAYVKAGQPKKAIAELKVALQFVPDDADAKKLLTQLTGDTANKAGGKK